MKNGTAAEHYDGATMVEDGTELLSTCLLPFQNYKGSSEKCTIGYNFLFFLFKQTVQLSCRNIIPT